MDTSLPVPLAGTLPVPVQPITATRIPTDKLDDAGAVNRITLPEAIRWVP